MKRLTLVVLVLAVLVASVDAQDPARLLKAAMNTEMVDHNPKAAIEQYKKVVAAGDRALAAQALLRMAGCYEKLGDAEGQKIYAQIIRDYADQTLVVVEARRSVASLPGNREAVAVADPSPFPRPSLGFLDGNDGTARVSPDGKFIAYAAQSRVYLRPMSGGNERLLVDLGPAAPFGRSIKWSPNSRFVAFSTGNLTTGTADIRVATLATGDTRILLTWNGTAISQLTALQVSWSPDSRTVAFVRPRVPEGDGPCTAGQSASSCLYEVRLGSITGGEPTLLGSSDTYSAIMWSPGGRELAFAMRVDKQFSIQIVTPAGLRRRIVPVAGSPTPLAWTSANELWFRQGTNEYFVLPDNGDGANKVPLDSGDTWIGVMPDSASVIVHKGGSRRLVVRRVSDGTEHPMTTGAGQEGQAMLSPDGRTVFFASNRDGKWALYVAPIDQAPVANPIRLAALDGVPTGSASTVSGDWSIGGGVLIANPPYREFHIARVPVDPMIGRPTGVAERLTVAWPENFGPVTAPDGKHVAFHSTNNSRGSLVVMDPDGGHERVLLDHYRVKLRWRTSEELIYGEGDERGGLGSAFFLLNISTGTVRRPAYPDLPIDQALDRLWDWDYLAATDEILYITAPIASLMKGPYTFRRYSLKDGTDRVVTTRERVDPGSKVLTASPDGLRAAYSSGNAIKVLDLSTPTEDRSLTIAPGVRTSLAWSPSGQRLVVCNANGRCTIAGLDTAEYWPLDMPTGANASDRWFDASWSPDGSTILATRGGVRMGWVGFEGVTYDAVIKLMSARLR